MNRYTHSFLISSFLYGILVAGFMFMITKTDKVLVEHVVKVVMIKPQEEVLEQKQAQKTEIVKEKAEQKPKDEPIKQIKPTNNHKSIAAKQPETSKQKEKSEEEKQQQTAQKPSYSAEAEKNKFLMQLKNEIRKNKHYPAAARRRGQEGVVEISFRVNSDGSVSNVVCSGMHPVLNNAAKDAVSKAFPVQISQNIVGVLPVDLSLVLDFKLDS